MTTYWTVETMCGDEVSTGMDEATARGLAADLAARTGDAHYVYETVDGEAQESEEVSS